LKVKVTYTIDSDLVQWLKQKENQSEFLSSLIQKSRSREADYKIVWYKLVEQIEKLEEKKVLVEERIEMIIEEGNKKERDEARSFLESKKMQEKKKLQEKQKRIDFWHKQIKKNDSSEVIITQMLSVDIDNIEDMTNLGFQLLEEFGLCKEKPPLDEMRPDAKAWKRPIAYTELKELILYLKDVFEQGKTKKGKGKPKKRGK